MEVTTNPVTVTVEANVVDVELLEKVLRLTERLDRYLLVWGQRADWPKVRRIVDEVTELLRRAVGERVSPSTTAAPASAGPRS